jgi:hypothetical protein
MTTFLRRHSGAVRQHQTERQQTQNPPSFATAGFWLSAQNRFRHLMKDDGTQALMSEDCAWNRAS